MGLNLQLEKKYYLKLIENEAMLSKFLKKETITEYDKRVLKTLVDVEYLEDKEEKYSRYLEIHEKVSEELSRKDSETDTKYLEIHKICLMSCSIRLAFMNFNSIIKDYDYQKTIDYLVDIEEDYLDKDIFSLDYDKDDVFIMLVLAYYELCIYEHNDEADILLERFVKEEKLFAFEILGTRKIGGYYFKDNSLNFDFNMFYDRKYEATGIELLLKAEKLGSRIVCKSLGDYYINDDSAKAFEYYMKHYNNGFLGSAEMIGAAYSAGNIVEKNLEKARYFFEKMPNSYEAKKYIARIDYEVSIKEKVYSEDSCDLSNRFFKDFINVDMRNDVDNKYDDYTKLIWAIVNRGLSGIYRKRANDMFNELKCKDPHSLAEYLYLKDRNAYEKMKPLELIGEYGDNVVSPLALMDSGGHIISSLAYEEPYLIKLAQKASEDNEQAKLFYAYKILISKTKEQDYIDIAVSYLIELADEKNNLDAKYYLAAYYSNAYSNITDYYDNKTMYMEKVEKYIQDPLNYKYFRDTEDIFSSYLYYKNEKRRE